MDQEWQLPDNTSGEQTKINVTDKTPIEYWANLLDCKKVDLEHAISVIGNSYKIIDLYLILNRQKCNKAITCKVD